MPPLVALCLCIAFVLMLFLQDLRRQGKISSALWIPFLWIVILGSRPISTWFGVAQAEGSDAYLEGSPVDRMVFLLLIVAGLYVLKRRQVSWQAVIANNIWVLLYFAYLAISVLWSDFAFIAFKRWIKDFGNVIMVLVILSEEDPIEAVRAVFVRAAFVLVPFSVLFAKYYPGLGRYYDRWEGRPSISGVSLDKNLLGLTLLVCGVFLFWNLVDMVRRESGDRDKGEILECLILMAMTSWLLLEAHCATAFACSIGCVGIFLAIRHEKIRTGARLFAISSCVAVALLLTWMAGVDWVGMSAKALGRDSTLTGRSDIWKSVLNEDINPIIGTGFYSFWLGDRSEKLSDKYFYLLNEAHNGYVETYLNSGLIGLGLLLILLGSAAKKIGRSLGNDDHYAPLRLAFLVTAMLYNITESLFNRLDLVWVVLLLVVIEYPHQELETSEDEADRSTTETELDVTEINDAQVWPAAGRNYGSGMLANAWVRLRVCGNGFYSRWQVVLRLVALHPGHLCAPASKVMMGRPPGHEFAAPS